MAVSRAGARTHQYETPLPSSQRSWNAQMSAAAMHTPMLCRMSPTTWATAARIT